MQTMASVTTDVGNNVQGRERRQFPRHMVKSLAYLDIGPNNGGIVLNISETGLAVHAVSVLPTEPILGLRLQLPRSAKRLEAKAKIAWMSETKKDAGVEFIDLDEEARVEIKQWLASENLPPSYIESAPASEPAPPSKPKRTDKWTSLVSQMSSAPEGIDRTLDRTLSRPLDRTLDPTVAIHDASLPPPAFTDPEPAAEMIAPPLPDDIPLVASNNSASEILETGVGIAEPATKDATEILAQLSAPPEPGPAIAAEEPKQDLIGDRFAEDEGADSAPPNDAMLPSSPRRPFSIVPNRMDKTSASAKARNLRDSDTTAAQEDDFLKKARELFGPKRGSREELAMRSSSPVVNPPPEPALAVVPQEELAHEDVPPLPLAQSARLDPAPFKESPIPDSQEASAPPTSAPPRVLPNTAGPRAALARSSRRATDLPGMLGIFALCLTLSALCLGLGILVGRNAALRSRDISSSAGSDVAKPSQPASADSANNSGSISGSNGAGGSAPHGPNRLSARDRSGRGQQSPRAASKTAQGDTDRSDSTQNATNDTSAADSHASEASAAAPPAQTAAPVAGTPRTSLETRAVPPPSDSATQTQPPSERLVPAHVIYRVEPFYPRAALQQRVEGAVGIRATVGKDGRVRNLRVLSGPAPLTAAALDAAQYWRYIPALKNGEPVETEEEISIEFQLTR
jgi:TonB family protein